MPPLSQTKIDVGMVSSPGCSKTIRGLRRSPSTSQSALPNARAPAVHVANAASSRQSGMTPQCANSRDRCSRARRARCSTRRAPGPTSPRPGSHPWPSRSGSPASRGRRSRPRRARRRSRRTVCGCQRAEHAVRGGADQHVRGRCRPGQAGRLGQQLMRLHERVLREAAPVGLVAPDPRARRDDRVAAGGDPRVGGIPHAAVRDDLVADADVVDALADRPDDAGGVAAADVEVLGLARLAGVRR